MAPASATVFLLPLKLSAVRIFVDSSFAGRCFALERQLWRDIESILKDIQKPDHQCKIVKTHSTSGVIDFSLHAGSKMIREKSI